MHSSWWATTSKPGELVAKLCQEQFCSYRCRSAATRSRTVPRGVCNFTGRGQQRPYTRSLAARPQTVSPWIAVAQPLFATRRSHASRQACPSRPPSPKSVARESASGAPFLQQRHGRPNGYQVSLQERRYQEPCHARKIAGYRHEISRQHRSAHLQTSGAK